MSIELNVPVQFITGVAGTGKTFGIKQKIEQEPMYAVLGASTGVSAVNLNTSTIHSILGFYDLTSLRDSFFTGRLQRKIKEIVKQGYQNIVIDEVSMLGGEMLDIILMAMNDINNQLSSNLGLIIVGDACLGKGTKVMMADGSIKNVEDVEVGDQVMGPDFQPRNVLRCTTGIDEMYHVHQTNGDDYIVNKKHSLVLKRGVNGQRREVAPSQRISRITGESQSSWQRYERFPDYVEMEAEIFHDKPRKFKECFVGYKAGMIPFSEKVLSIEPYFLGLWLGDGDKDSARVTTQDREVISYLKSYARDLGLGTRIQEWKNKDAVRVSLSHGKSLGNAPSPLRSALRSYSLLNNKHIPDDYLYSSEDQRLQLLAGLIDSDGCWAGNRYSISLTLSDLARQVKQLADQLGFRAALNYKAAYRRNHQDTWTITIGGDTWRIPCRIARKISQPRNLMRSRLTSVLTLTPIGLEAYYGFETDGDHLFLLGDGTVTHNCQLPPVKSKWFFESDYWPLFDANTTRLTKIWRQSDERFLNALNLARMGDGARCFDALTNDCSVALHTTLDDSFQGTTILGKNEEVNRYNQYRLSRMSGQSFANSRIIKGLALREWEKHIPLQQTFKVGAYVMILHNYYEDTLKGKELVYANGDTAYIKEVIGDGYIVELVRNKREVLVTRIERHNTRVSKPFDEEIKRIKFEHDYDVEQVQVGGQKLWSLGYVNYMPLNLAWASTCHKSQGLTLDRVQFDLREHFVGHPGLSYVALSRCRSAEGLRLVGNRELFKRRIKVDPKVARFI